MPKKPQVRKPLEPNVTALSRLVCPSSASFSFIAGCERPTVLIVLFTPNFLSSRYLSIITVSARQRWPKNDIRLLERPPCSPCFLKSARARA